MQLLFSGTIPSRDEPRGIRALLGVLDTESGEIIHRCEYRRPADLWFEGQKVQFTGFCFAHGALWVCSHNEIVRYDDWPPRRPTGRISIQGFNDLHHCIPWRGALAVANTGLETIDIVSLEGELLERWDLLLGLPGARRIDPGIDYRMLDDTKPHHRHPNHLFTLRDELWTSQLQTSDAICVTTPGARIDLAVGMPHDGDIVNGELLFTTVNGFIVFANLDPPFVTKPHDLNPLTPELNQLGWCRGVCADPQQEGRFFVGFSKVRRTRWKDLGFRVKHGHTVPLGRISHYDLYEGKLLREYGMGSDPGITIFQICVLPERLQL